MTTALTRKDLDPLRCGNPDCNCAGPLVLSPELSLGRAGIVEYDWTTGILATFCSECRLGIVQIAVAAENPS